MLDESPTEVWQKQEGHWFFVHPETGARTARTWANVFAACKIPMEYLDDQELELCLLRKNVTGELHAPLTVTRRPLSMQAARARKSELMRRTMEHNDSLIGRYMKVYEEVALDQNVDAQHRIRAADSALDRIVGKASQKLEVTAQVAVWEQGIAGLLVELDYEPTETESNTGGDSDERIPEQADRRAIDN